MKTVRGAKEEEGQEARCIVTALETRRIPDGTKDREYTLLLVRLLTGRTHQIRVQLASRGHAIVGDPWYGKKEAGLKLHAFRLSIPLPDGSKRQLELLPPWKGAWKVTRV
jgi:23S rRNA pseudouridine955/2504/2580 synthase